MKVLTRDEIELVREQTKQMKIDAFAAKVEDMTPEILQGMFQAIAGSHDAIISQAELILELQEEINNLKE